MLPRYSSGHYYPAIISNKLYVAFNTEHNDYTYIESPSVVLTNVKEKEIRIYHLRTGPALRATEL